MLSSLPTHVFSTGDSLSDARNIFDVTDALLINPLTIPVQGELLDGQPGYGTGFSNGEVHIQTLADLFGAELTGYAAGGARILGTRTVSSQIGDIAALIPPIGNFGPLLDYDINMDAQVARIIAGDAPNPTASAPVLPPDATVLVTYFAGLNDILDFAGDLDTSTVSPLTVLTEGLGVLTNLATSTAGHLLALAALPQVDQIAAYRLPPLSFFPIPEGTDLDLLALFDAFISAYNITLEATVAGLTGAETLVIELDRIADAIASDPETFGFVGKGGFYFGGGGAPEVEVSLGGIDISFPENPDVPDGTDPDQLQFFDSLHFSGQTHGIIGAFGAASLSKEAVFLNDAANLRVLGDGPQLVLAEDGRDVITTGGGDDAILAGRDDDIVFARAGDDVVIGGSGNDRLSGNPGQDVVAGGSGDDVVRGGNGDDLVLDGAGSDIAFGGAGDDVFVWLAPDVRGFGAADDSDLFTGNSGTDTLYLVIAAPDAALQAEVEAQGGNGRWDLDVIGVEVRGVEFVVLLDGGRDDIGTIATPTPDQMALADAWGLL